MASSSYNANVSLADRKFIFSQFTLQYCVLVCTTVVQRGNGHLCTNSPNAAPCKIKIGPFGKIL